MLWGVASSPTPADPAGAGIPDSPLPGPYPVGEYSAALRSRLRQFARVQVMGELVNLRPSRARVYFELRDANGALPCSAWRGEWDAMSARAGVIPSDGMQIVVAGGCDYYPGSASASPGFSFAVSDLRVAGEGDLLARIERLRKQLDAEGLLTVQRTLPRVQLPRTIGVVTGEGGKARGDVLAALDRRGWAGRLVWAFTPVQDRHAAPAIVRALGDLAAIAEVDVIIVARGGGSLADLLAFCDETLCRTVATAARSRRWRRSDTTPTGLSSTTSPRSAAPRRPMRRRPPWGSTARAHASTSWQRPGACASTDAGRCSPAPRGSRCSRARPQPTSTVSARAFISSCARSGRGPARRLENELEVSTRRAIVLARKSASSILDCRERRPRELERLAMALAGHDPQRTLERGYVLASTAAGDPVVSASQAPAGAELRLRFADGERNAMILDR